ncbi:MAG TPA: PAS domain S-box protein [Gammaproteobacteria bacterium]|nr:PAS domain S-box protein [Gammaproteobacteria bacterium]
MTAHKAASEEMMANAELLALFDAAVDAMVVTDETGRLLTFNRAAEKVFGHRSEDVVGRGVELLMPDPYRERHGRYMRRYLETGRARIIGIGREVEGLRANGETFPLHLSVGEAVSGGRRRFVGIMRDLSAERAAETRTRSLESRLAHVDRFSLMGEMAAGIAHELNQPLSAIATYAQAAKRLLQREPIETPALLQVCEKIDSQARRAGLVISNVRQFIRRRENRTDLLEVSRIIEDVWEMVQADAHAAGIPIALRLAEGLPYVLGDAVQLQQVLLNLTRNSVDATRTQPDKRQGIIVETCAAPEGRVRISVIDHGPGVSSSLGQDIFDPFVTTKPEGLGVGLAISRTIVQASGGVLSYTGNPGGGAIFTIDLPSAKAEGEPG